MDRRDYQPKSPWHFRLLVYLLTGMGAFILWCWFKTLRVSVIGEVPDPRRAAVYASWHRSLLYAVYYWRWWNGFMMASASKDGEWAAGIIQRFGNRVVRGSSSRGGRAALNDLVEAMKAGVNGGLLPDAPRGPAQKCKPGILALAQRTGLSIIPVQFAAERCVRLRSWDRTIIPMPFSRLVVAYGEPFAVAADMSDETFDRRLAELDEAMNRLTEQVDQYFAA